MASDKQPSDYVAAFLWDRLVVVARILFDARVWVAEQATPERGDSRTGIGFRAWEHCTRAIELAAIRDHGEWLSVPGKGPRFVFKIGGMPIRFYRGDSEEPIPERYADPDFLELEQIEMALVANVGIEFKGYYRMVVRADGAGMPLAIYLVGVDFDNVIRMAWEIPLGEASATAPIMVPQSPVPLPPLTILTNEEAEREEKERIERERAERERAAKQNPNIKGA